MCDIVRGGSPRPIEHYMTSSKEGLNWLKIGDINHNDKYIIKTTGKIKEEGLKYTRFLKKDSFIISNSMSFGRPYILNIDTCIHDGWLALENISNKVNKSYLYYLIISDYCQSQFKNFNSFLISNGNNHV